VVERLVLNESGVSTDETLFSESLKRFSDLLEVLLSD
jgi:hypothetical protein